MWTNAISDKCISNNQPVDYKCDTLSAVRKEQKTKRSERTSKFPSTEDCWCISPFWEITVYYTQFRQCKLSNHSPSSPPTCEVKLIRSSERQQIDPFLATPCSRFFQFSAALTLAFFSQSVRPPDGALNNFTSPQTETPTHTGALAEEHYSATRTGVYNASVSPPSAMKNFWAHP